MAAPLYPELQVAPSILPLFSEANDELLPLFIEEDTLQKGTEKISKPSVMLKILDKSIPQFNYRLIDLLLFLHPSLQYTGYYFQFFFFPDLNMPLENFWICWFRDMFSEFKDIMYRHSFENGVHICMEQILNELKLVQNSIDTIFIVSDFLLFSDLVWITWFLIFSFHSTILLSSLPEIIEVQRNFKLVPPSSLLTLYRSIMLHPKPWFHWEHKFLSDSLDNFVDSLPSFEARFIFCYIENPFLMNWEQIFKSLFQYRWSYASFSNLEQYLFAFWLMEKFSHTQILQITKSKYIIIQEEFSHFLERKYHLRLVQLYPSIYQWVKFLHYITCLFRHTNQNLPMAFFLMGRLYNFQEDALIGFNDESLYTFKYNQDDLLDCEHPHYVSQIKSTHLFGFQNSCQQSRFVFDMAYHKKAFSTFSFQLTFSETLFARHMFEIFHIYWEVNSQQNLDFFWVCNPQIAFINRLVCTELTLSSIYSFIHFFVSYKFE